MRLHDYQRDIIEHILTHKRCAVWAPMGAGKTAATLGALAAIQVVEGRTPALVIAPRRVAVDVWPAEAKKWESAFGLTCVAVAGAAEQRLAALGRDADVHTINYENLPWLMEVYGSRWRWGVVVADEATRLKSFRLRGGGRRAKALAQVAHAPGLTHFIELTGTPSPNGLMDLWGQIWFLDKGQRLGRTLDSFRERWFTPAADRFGAPAWGYTPLPHAFKEVQQLLSDICRTIDPPFAVDQPVITDVPVVLPPAVMRAYRKLEQEAFVKLANEKEVTAANAAVLTNKCRQYANGAVLDEHGVAHVVHDAKLEALESIINEAGGAPVLVVYEYVADDKRIRRRFGGASIADAGAMDRWNRGELPLMTMHPASAGHGLNLQHGGNRIVFFGLSWNLEHYLQAIERIGPLRQRQAGYDRPCLVYRIIAKDTIDEDVALRLASKRSVQDVLLDAMRRRNVLVSRPACPGQPV